MLYQRWNVSLASPTSLALAVLVTGAAAGPLQAPGYVLLAEEPLVPSGVTPGDWSSIQGSISAHRRAFEATHRGFEARNPRFNWDAHFDGTSALIQPAARDWSFGFALKSFGFKGEMQHVDVPMFGTCIEGQEMTYSWNSELSEWWINDERGLEHGFTVHERPASLDAMSTSPLVFELDTLGSLQPRVNETRTGLILRDAAGLSVLRYDGLVAFDANGARLPAWLEVHERRVRICVDEALAEYPILVDPVVQEGYIKASNTEPTDQFGSSIAASGDTIVVGAPGEDSDSRAINGNQSNASSGSFFNGGAAYVFVRSGSTWTQQAYLKASNTDSGDSFGTSVAISGDTVLVGAPREDSSAAGVNGNQSNNDGTASGAAYVFVRSGASWTQEAYLKASSIGLSDGFGETVAISGDTVVVGAPFEDSITTGIDGDESDNSASWAGAAYVFARAGSSWTQQAYLKASNTNADLFFGDLFGSAVAISGDTVVVGAWREDSNATGVNGDQFNSLASNAGAAYVFARMGSSWTQQAYLKASNAEEGDHFGWSVAASGDTVVVGAHTESSNAVGVNGPQGNGSLESGAAYVFVRSGSSWTQEAYLKASNTGIRDQFGCAVAASGNTVVVGAFGEDSRATGIDGNQQSNNRNSAGAAYVFVRSGSTWTQDSYLKASNTGAGDVFGLTLAASGNTIVVGAVNEDSSATGVDGDASDNLANNSGAVYVFNDVGGLGTPYCTAAPNSTGAVGELVGSGSASVADNDLTLVAVGLPPLSFGFYLTSMVQGFVMNPGGSEGNLCLGGAIGRYVGPSQVLLSDGNGRYSLLLDLMNTPQPNGAVSINAGETWNFQGWHRDFNMTGSTSNLTNGLEVLFSM